MPQRPPRLAERLLAATLGRGEWSESILGDLHEEYLHYVELTGSAGGLRAGAWYWAQSLRLASRSLFERGDAGLPFTIHGLAPFTIHGLAPSLTRLREIRSCKRWDSNCATPAAAS